MTDKQYPQDKQKPQQYPGNDKTQGGQQGYDNKNKTQGGHGQDKQGQDKGGYGKTPGRGL